MICTPSASYCATSLTNCTLLQSCWPDRRGPKQRVRCAGGGNRSVAPKMIPDLDIYRSANVLVKHHGPDAPIQAVVLDGYAVWKRILRAVGEHS